MNEAKRHHIAVICAVNENRNQVIAQDEGRQIATVFYNDAKYFTGCEAMIILGLVMCCGIGLCVDYCCVMPSHRRKAIKDAIPELTEKVAHHFSWKYGWLKSDICINFIFSDDKLNKDLPASALLNRKNNPSTDFFDFKRDIGFDDAVNTKSIGSTINSL